MDNEEANCLKNLDEPARAVDALYKAYHLQCRSLQQKVVFTFFKLDQLL